MKTAPVESKLSDERKDRTLKSISAVTGTVLALCLHLSALAAMPDVWKARSSPSSAQLNSVAYGNGSFVALGGGTIPNSVTTVGRSAFQSCDNLKSVTLGNAVTNIRDAVFQYCYYRLHSP